MSAINNPLAKAKNQIQESEYFADTYARVAIAIELREVNKNLAKLVKDAENRRYEKYRGLEFPPRKSQAQLTRFQRFMRRLRGQR